MFDRRTVVVKQRVAFVKLSDTYDFLGARSEQAIGVAYERLSGAIKALHLIRGKRFLS